MAAAENIVEVRLDENSTPQQFVMHFFNKFLAGLSTTLFLRGCLEGEIERADGTREKI